MEITPKSFQEMAAQIIDAQPFFSDNSMPNGHATKLAEQANSIATEVAAMCPYMLDDSKLAPQLAKLKQRATNIGAWDPTKGEGSTERIAFAVEQIKGYGYTKEEAGVEALKKLQRNGYLNAIRDKRKKQEQLFQDPVNHYVKEQWIDSIVERQEIDHLLERTIDIATMTATQLAKLSQAFPSGNFVYHGAVTEQLVKILASGVLANAKALYEREKIAAKNEGREASIIRHNSGFEGISWSMNGIDALPGDRYHLAGFIGAPESILSDAQQLAIPSRPAPNEVLQISSAVEADRFYDAKTQFELYRNQGIFGELNSAFNNLLSVSMWKNNDNGQLCAEPMLYRAQRGLLAQPNYQERLRKLYAAQPDGTVRLNPDLLQQINNEVPVAAAWLQAVIDNGRLKDTAFFDKELPEVIDTVNADNIKELLAEMRKDWQPFEDVLDEEEEIAGSVEVPVEKMYFVAPQKDLEVWLKVMARSKHKPAGILLYDDKEVRLENFASLHMGDHSKLTNELQTAINPNNDSYINYADVLGSKLSDGMRAGYRHQVIAERHLSNRKTVRKIKGQLVVEK